MDDLISVIVPVYNVEKIFITMFVKHHQSNL